MKAETFNAQWRTGRRRQDACATMKRGTARLRPEATARQARWHPEAAARQARLRPEAAARQSSPHAIVPGSHTGDGARTCRRGLWRDVDRTRLLCRCAAQVVVGQWGARLLAQLVLAQADQAESNLIKLNQTKKCGKLNNRHL